MQEQFIIVIKNTEVDEYLQHRGTWLLANVDQSIGWPEDKTIIVFRNIKISLIPSTEQYYPAAAVLCKTNVDVNKNKRLLLHFLSSLSWCYSGKLHNVGWTNSSSMG